MDITIAPNGYLQIDDAKIIWPNFSGNPGKFSREGERDFTLLIPDQEACDLLLDDVNDDGAAWNVKIKPPREEGDEPFMHLKVKVRFSAYGPRVYLKTGNKTVELNEETIKCLDNIEFERVDMDVRPYDNITNGKPYRTAYLDSMHVTQKIDRFAARYMDDMDDM